jgi:hypothetical protein
MPGRTRHRHITSPPPPGSLQSFRRVLPDACTSYLPRINVLD